MRKIQTFNASCLREIAEPVLFEEICLFQQEQGETYELVQEMKEILAKSGNGLGLSAPQVGVMSRVIVMKSSDEEIFHVINPKIVGLDKENLSVSYEGCLSLPTIFAHVHRPAQVTVEYNYTNPVPTTAVFDGLEATVFLHEFDHLNGILFVDRCLNRNQRRLMSKQFKLEVQQIEILEGYE